MQKQTLRKPFEDFFIQARSATELAAAVFNQRLTHAFPINPSERKREKVELLAGEKKKSLKLTVVNFKKANAAADLLKP